jgi:hypothetical protein
MSGPRNNAPKTRGRPFQPGNPGRPKGARHRVTLAVEALLEGQHEALTQKAIEKALEGDTVALRLCLDRIAPPRRDAPISFELPPIVTIQDAVTASAQIIAAVAAGEISPDEAGRVIALLAGHRQLIETVELEARIAALEQKS